MAELSREDRWKKLQEELERPVKLSNTEKEKLRNIFKQVHDLLDENLEQILEASRDDAYRYANLLIQAFNQADADYADGVQVVESDRKPTPDVVEDEEEETERISVNLELPIAQAERATIELGPRPDFHKILGQLSEREREKARRLLDCVRSGLALEEMGEDPSQSLCHGLDRHCSVEEMKACLRTEDPSILDEMDRDLQNRRRTG